MNSTDRTTVRITGTAEVLTDAQGVSLTMGVTVAHLHQVTRQGRLAHALHGPLAVDRGTAEVLDVERQRIQILDPHIVSRPGIVAAWREQPGAKMQ